MITISGLGKSFGLQTVFEDVSFTIGDGERAGLVGRNGSGKTTLFRILLGEEKPDGGTVAIPKGYRIGHLSQHIDFREGTVLGEACRNLPADDDGTDRTFQVKTILQGLGFGQHDFGRKPGELSGGYQVRLNLARLLASDPDLILLDEPTNYLDILSIRWLERFLRGWKREMVLITHDREFMDSVTTHTMAIHRGKIRKIQGSTEKMYGQIMQDEQVHEQTRLNEERVRRDLERFINRFRAQAARARAVQSKIRSLEKREPLEKLAGEQTLEFEFSYSPFHGKWLLEARDLCFSYDNSPELLGGFHLAVKKGDRIGVIGRNGQGKTTLLNLLAGDLAPVSGAVVVHDNVEISHFNEKKVGNLGPDNTVEEEMSSSLGAVGRKAVRGICGAMMFTGDKALKRIRVLSGGEKSRVLLGKLIASPSNVLILDEPTNHLDMESIDSLIEALDTFEGALIIVTHSEMMLKSLAKRLVVFDESGPSIFEGTYQDFLDRVGWKSEASDAAQARERESSERRRIDRKELRRQRADVISRRSKIITPLRERMEELERNIVTLERKIDEDNRDVLTAIERGDGKAIQSLSISIHNGRKEIDESFDELERVSLEFNKWSREFDEELKILGEEDEGATASS